MIILHDKATLLHETVELLGAKLTPALESPSRINAIVQGIEESQRHDLRVIAASEDDQITAVELAKATHDAAYLDHIQNVFKQWLGAGLVESHESVLPECFRLHNVARSTLHAPKDIYARAGFYAFDMSTGITVNSWKAIIASANLAVQAARQILSSSTLASTNGNGTATKITKSIVALCRPPGHHCTGSQAGGYCYTNNIALAVTALRQFSQPNTPAEHLHSPPNSSLRFAILDIDFHHGNGTQSQFYDDPNVFYVSIHGEDEFPYYTGAADERGPKNHAAYGTNLNLPLATGSTVQQYLEKLDVAVAAVETYKPDYLLVSLGFDTFHLDPLGKFDITTEDYEVLARRIRLEITVPALIVLEGGYVIDRLGENLLMFLKGWEDAEQSGR